MFSKMAEGKSHFASDTIHVPSVAIRLFTRKQQGQEEYFTIVRMVLNVVKPITKSVNNQNSSILKQVHVNGINHGKIHVTVGKTKSQFIWFYFCLLVVSFSLSKRVVNQKQNSHKVVLII